MCLVTDVCDILGQMCVISWDRCVGYLGTEVCDILGHV